MKYTSSRIIAAFLVAVAVVVMGFMLMGFVSILSMLTK